MTVPPSDPERRTGKCARLPSAVRALDWTSRWIPSISSSLSEDSKLVKKSGPAPKRLTAEVAWHRPVRPAHTHIKAVTYHLLRVAETGDGWLAEVYFDL